MENVTCLGETVRSARVIAPHAESSVTLQFAPDGSTDPRAQSPLGAAWVAGSIATLAGAGVDAISVAGTIIADSGAANSPVSPVVRMLAGRRGATTLATTPSDELAVAALALERDRHRELLLVNLRDAAVEVEIATVRERRRTLAPYEVAIIGLA